MQNREIKFRAWDKAEKKMLVPHGLIFNPTIAAIDHGILGIDVNPGSKDYEVMQYTGLKDKNGIDLYDQDIVTWDGGQYTVIFSEYDGAWILKDDRDDNYCPSLYARRIVRKDITDLQIIGNVWEGPKEAGTKQG